MEFTAPLALLLLPLRILFARWMRHRPEPAIVYSDLRLFDAVPIGRGLRWQRLSGWLIWLGISVLILAIAGPRIEDPLSGERLPTQGIAISVVLDTSGSMGAVDFPETPGGPLTSRLEAAKRTLRRFLEGGTGPNSEVIPNRLGDQVGLVTFASWPIPVCPLTLSHSVLLGLLDQQKPATTLTDGSNIGDAIVEGLLQLQSAEPTRRVLILLSDGEHNFDRDGPSKPRKPRQAAQIAAAMGVPIYAIDIGGEPIAIDEKSDAQTKASHQQRLDGRAVLTSIAELTQGRMFIANDAAAMQSVTQAIDQLMPSPVETFRYRRYTEYRMVLTSISLGLLLFGGLIRGTWGRVSP